MTRHLTAAPLVLTAVLFLVSSTGYAQYTYQKTKDQSASQRHTHPPSGQPGQAAQQQVTGQVQRTKNVEVRTLEAKGQAEQNRVVLLQTEQGRRVVVDLGPAAAWQRINLKPGAQLSASGQWVRIGDRPILWATQATVDGETMQIKRPQRGQSRQVTGQIMRTKQVEIRGMDLINQAVLLQTAQGRQIVADLGPMANLRGIRLQPGAEIQVRGRPVRIGDQLVLLADQVSAGGKTVSVHRPQQTAQQRAGAGRQASRAPDGQQSPARINVTAASNIIGREVRDVQGNRVGEVLLLMINAYTGDVRYLLVNPKQGPQETLDLIPVPWMSVTLQGQAIEVNATSETLKQVPHVKLSDVAQLTQPWLVTRVHNYYVTPEQQRQGHNTRQPSQGQQGQQQQSAEDQGSGSPHQRRAERQAPSQGGAGGSSFGSQPQAGPSRQGGSQAGEPHILIGRGIVTTLFPPMYATATEVRGTAVESTDGQYVGDIDKIMIDTDHGHVAYVLIAPGGVLSGPEEWLPVPFEALQWLPQGFYKLNVDAQQLKQVRGIAKQELPAQVRTQQLQKLYERFGVTPYWEQA